MYTFGNQRILCVSLLGDNKKDKYATEGHRKDGLYIQALRKIKSKFPEIALMTDIAMVPILVTATMES